MPAASRKEDPVDVLQVAPLGDLLDREVELIARHEVDTTAALNQALLPGCTATLAPTNPIFSDGFASFSACATLTSLANDGVEVCSTTSSLSRAAFEHRFHTEISAGGASISLLPSTKAAGCASHVGNQKRADLPLGLVARARRHRRNHRTRAAAGTGSSSSPVLSFTRHQPRGRDIEHVPTPGDLGAAIACYHYGDGHGVPQRQKPERNCTRQAPMWPSMPTTAAALPNQIRPSSATAPESAPPETVTANAAQNSGYCNDDSTKPTGAMDWIVRAQRNSWANTSAELGLRHRGSRQGPRHRESTVPSGRHQMPQYGIIR